MTFEHKSSDLGDEFEGRDIDELNEDGETVLWAAVRADDFNRAEKLLELHADIGIKNKMGESLLYFAAENGKNRMVQMLLNNLAKPNEKIDGVLPIIIAAYKGHVDVVTTLLNSEEYVQGKIRKNEVGSRKETLETIEEIRQAAIKLFVEKTKDDLDKVEELTTDFQKFDSFVKRMSNFTSVADPNHFKLIQVINESYRLYQEGRSGEECIQFLRANSIGLFPQRFGIQPLQFFDFDSSFYTKNRIDILVGLARSHENALRVSMKPKESLKVLLEVYSDLVEDKNWFAKVSASFEKAMIEDVPPRLWLSQQLKDHDVHLANEEFQVVENESTNEEVCLTFAYRFLKNRDDEYFSDGSLSVDERAKKLVEDDCLPTSYDNLKAGDVILYLDDVSECTHIALYVGKIDGTDYAVSKFGSGSPVFIHPIANHPEYGEPYFYTHKQELSAGIAQKFKQLHKSMPREPAMEDEGLKSRSGYPRFWHDHKVEASPKPAEDKIPSPKPDKF